MWLLRLGYYKLNRPKEKGEDWVWIVDHIIQTGTQKSMLILGIRLSSMPKERSLRYEDLEPLALMVVTKSTGEIVYQQLEETIKKTGIPRQIVADEGSDLKAGINKFVKKHPETDYMHDIKHKGALVLKGELGKDEEWLKFTKLANQTKNQVQQTVLAPLAPPKQKSKARYMNVDILIRWGEKMTAFFEQAQQEGSEFDLKQVEEKFGWILEFETQLSKWGEMLEVVTIIESFVRKKGLYNGCSSVLKELPTLQVSTQCATRVCQKLLTFVEEQEKKAKPNERLAGSSEVIESVFGKFKQVEDAQAKSGFTGLLLSLPAMVSTTTPDIVKRALETVPVKDVLAWCKENLGVSIQAKRKKAFSFFKKTEQKWHLPSQSP